jgi:hypothetical protein
MSLVLELPLELEKELGREAAHLGLSLSEYALRVLAAGRVPGPPPRNGAELVAYWQGAGLIGTRPEIADVPQHARTIRQKARRRERPEAGAPACHRAGDTGFLTMDDNK